jgi:pyruvate formate lyase activating enzyme
MDEILETVARRKSLVPGIVLTGGEPLLCARLPEIISACKAAGLSVKLDTNGTFPDRLGALFDSAGTSPDYVAIDLKTSPSLYPAISPVKSEVLFEKVARSIKLLQSGGIAFEIRTLALPNFMDDSIVEELSLVVPDNVPWFFGAFVPGSCLDPEWDTKEISLRSIISDLVAHAISLGKNAKARGLG